MHGNNLNSLHQLIHPEILPSEFGGMLPPYDMGTWARTLLDHEYDDDSEYNVDSYSMPVKDMEKELSPKSMKRYAGDSWEGVWDQSGDPNYNSRFYIFLK